MRAERYQRNPDGSTTLVEVREAVRVAGVPTFRRRDGAGNLLEERTTAPDEEAALRAEEERQAAFVARARVEALRQVGANRTAGETQELLSLLAAQLTRDG